MLEKPQFWKRKPSMRSCHMAILAHPSTQKYLGRSNYRATMNRKQADDYKHFIFKSFQYRLQDKPQFWKRKPSIVKCHMLILAHLARAEIPKTLRGDYSAIMKKCPLFLEEMINIANLPRPPAVRACFCNIWKPWQTHFEYSGTFSLYELGSERPACIAYRH